MTRNQEIYALWLSGMTLQAIGEQLGVSRQYIGHIVAKVDREIEGSAYLETIGGCGELSRRAINALHNNSKVQEPFPELLVAANIAKLSRDDLGQFYNVSTSTIKEIESALARRGLSLKPTRREKLKALFLPVGSP